MTTILWRIDDFCQSIGLYKVNKLLSIRLKQNKKMYNNITLIKPFNKIVYLPKLLFVDKCSQCCCYTRRSLAHKPPFRLLKSPLGTNDQARSLWEQISTKNENRVYKLLVVYYVISTCDFNSIRILRISN